MMYWDASGIVPLLVQEPETAKRERLFRKDPAIATWWGSKIECASALNRLHGDDVLTSAGLQQALGDLELLADSWTEIQATPAVQDRALRVLRVHPLRAADSLQLAAALITVDEKPRGFPFVCSDARLINAATREGFDVRE
ncbi:MAG: type II toxin-antitoxin system VapC family toxin [Verrucomicrobia bacterium]|nr:type II toxin-antitoxin system VapC family toxin [Verrucomicrobiota bacterium]MDA1087682.1 type II toxin-antitoxin system VapC family toxin [Verrucomicrobiota bacterium]